MAVCVNQDGHNQFGRISVLPKVVVLFFNFRYIYALEDGFIDVAVMIFGEQIKNIGWKQQVLIELNGAVLELWRWRHLAL